MKLLNLNKYLLHWLIVLSLFMIMFFVTWFSIVSPVAVDAAPAPTATPVTVTTPEPLYIEVQHGQRVYIQCGTVPDLDTQPAGQFTSPQFGVDVLILDCLEFGSTVAGEGMAVQLKDGGE